jgi:hypothetical protein
MWRVRSLIVRALTTLGLVPPSSCAVDVLGELAPKQRALLAIRDVARLSLEDVARVAELDVPVADRLLLASRLHFRDRLRKAGRENA